MNKTAARAFIEGIARLNHDGEELDCPKCGGKGCDECENTGKVEFDMTSDDAVETLNGLIREARELV